MSGRWNESNWNEGRWASLVVADLLLQAPTGGLPTGQEDWDLVVEILLPEVSSGLWGIGTWGDFDWGSLAWQDITTRVRGMEWTRGSDEVFGRPRVGRIGLSLDNADGLLDPWTAPSAQFLAPGTILRCGLISPTGIHDGTPSYIDLPGTAGNYLSTPDQAALDVAGDLEVVARVALDDWTPAAASAIVAKHGIPGTSTTGWSLIVSTLGRLQLCWGNGTARTATSSVAPTVSNGQTIWVKATLAVNNGAGGQEVRFYTAPDLGTEPTSWTQLGTTLTVAGTTTPITANTAGVNIGASTAPGNYLAAKLYQIIVRAGIGGTAVLNTGKRDVPRTQVSSYVAWTGQTITLNTSGSPATTIVDPGSSVRWLPQWTGIVETWAPMMSDAQHADRWIEVALNETSRDLAQVDDPALASVVGGGEGAAARTERLLVAAAWRYGYLCEAQNLTPAPLTNYAMQSTDMAANRISELYLVADSSDTQFRSIRDGRAASTASEYISNDGDADPAVWPGALISWYEGLLGRRIPRLILSTADNEVETETARNVYIAYRPETFKSQAQDTEISNAVTLQRVGGVEQTFRQLASIERYGQRSFVRRDLLNDTGGDPTVALLAQYVSIRRALATLRVEAVTIDTWARDFSSWLATICAEPTQAAQIVSPIPDSPQPYILGLVASIVHRVSPRVSGSSMLWETDIRIDTRTVANVPGAQLPATPA